MNETLHLDRRNTLGAETLREAWVHFKRLLSRWHLPVRFTFDDLVVAGDWSASPERQWADVPGLPDLPGFLDREVLAWLDEVILRAPAPRGIDEQIVGVGIWRGEADESTWKVKLVDKQGWRSQARQELRAWLADEAGRLGSSSGLGVTAQVLQLGRTALLLSRHLHQQRGDKPQ